jgi:hypothetical protein
MADNNILQIQIGSSLWKANPDYKFQFYLIVRLFLYGVHWGSLNQTLVHSLAWDFLKRKQLLISQNEINQIVIMSYICVFMTWSLFAF